MSVNNTTTRKPGQTGGKSFNFMPILVAGAAVVVVVLALVLIFSNNGNKPVDVATATTTPLPSGTDEGVQFSTPTPPADGTTLEPQATSTPLPDGEEAEYTPDPNATPSPSPKPYTPLPVSTADNVDALPEADARYVALKWMVDYANQDYAFSWDKGFSFLAVYPYYHSLEATTPVYYVYLIGDVNKKPFMEVYVDARKKGPSITWNDTETKLCTAFQKMAASKPNYEFEDDRVFMATSMGLLRKIKGKEQWYDLYTQKVVDIPTAKLKAHMDKQNIWTGKALETSLSTYLKSLRTTFGSKVPDVVTEKMMYEEWGAG